MICPMCHKQIPDKSSFCLFCGARMEQVAPPPPPDDVPSPTLQIEPEPGLEEDLFELPDLEDLMSLPEMTNPAQRSTTRTQGRVCKCCGRAIPQDSEQEVCVTCLYNRSFVASPMEEDAIGNEDSAEFGKPSERGPFVVNFGFDLDSEYPDTQAPKNSKISKGATTRQPRKAAPARRKPPEKPKRQPVAPCERTPIQLPAFLSDRRLLLLAGGIFVVILLLLVISLLFKSCGGEKPSNSPSDVPSSSDVSDSEPQLSNVERRVVNYAQAMVKKAAFAPDSVAFDEETITVSEQDGYWSVSQEFSRKVKTGETVTAQYQARLLLDREQTDGYRSLRLQVGEQVLYDYSSASPA